jgi:hypothetical protein
VTDEEYEQERARWQKNARKHRKAKETRFRPSLPFPDVPYGQCVFCGRETESIRRHWHKECIEKWQVATTTSIARARCFHNAQGICAACGAKHEQKDGLWEHDHIVPLWKIADLPLSEKLQYWMEGNLQLLCKTPCHRDKTTREAAERKRLRTIEQRNVKICDE